MHWREIKIKGHIISYCSIEVVTKAGWTVIIKNPAKRVGPVQSRHH
jgi:hypothetical protein